MSIASASTDPIRLLSRRHPKKSISEFLQGMSLQELETEHSTLDDRIAEASRTLDSVQLTELKREKLLYKDEIARRTTNSPAHLH